MINEQQICFASYINLGEQFKRLKFGDRYFYTHEEDNFYSQVIN